MRATRRKIALPYVTPRLFFDRLDRRRGMTAAVLIVLAIALFDELTGYALRLSIFYLVPIAFASWIAGVRMGIYTAILASLLWLLSFRTEHAYPHEAYYFWEATAMLGGFLAFAWLSDNLRRALRQADERFFRVLDAMQAAVYVADERSGAVVYANPGMATIAGNRPIALSSFEERFQSASESGGRATPEPLTGEFHTGTVRDKDTGRWYVLQSGTIPWGSNPHIKLKLLTDITAQKNAERLREKHLEVMHQAAQLSVLAETASTIAHEINQPLMVIATYTDACQRLLNSPDTDRDAISDALGKCHAQAVRAASIIQRLRDFIRQRQARTSVCDARSLIGEAIDIVQPILDEAGIRLEQSIEAPDAIIEIDRVLLVQVLVNLLRNAIEALRDNAPGQRRITITLAALSTAEISITIADNGCGLDSSSADQIFTPFFTSKPDGLGLGLTISRSVVEAHDGQLRAVNNAAGGATFQLSLPARLS